MRTADFDYELPPERIAQEPLPDRAGARLLVLERVSGTILHRAVRELAELLSPGDLLVLNDTRVLPARLFGRRATGGRVEVLLLHRQEPATDGPGQGWVALVRPARRVRAGEALDLIPRSGGEPVADPPRVRILELLGEGQVRVSLEPGSTGDVRTVLTTCGQIPLPPYIHTPLADPERYQTVYARHEGAVAAPTAGLHLTPELLAGLAERGIARACLTLHVGLGTFRPVAAEDPREHRMHAEWLEIPPATAEAIARTRRQGGRVVAVGTTVVRALESRAADDGTVRPGGGWTELYLLPGSRFRAVDALFTNFHLPRSTLLMLVAAFAGRERILEAYREAVAREYRFFSFGDAMLIL